MVILDLLPNFLMNNIYYNIIAFLIFLYYFFIFQQLRKLLLEILHRIPTNDHLRPYFQVSMECK